MKDPRSKDYAIQTLYALKRYAESLRCDQERVAKEMQEIEQYRHWEVLGYPSRQAMLDAELGELGRENVARVLGKRGGQLRNRNAANDNNTSDHENELDRSTSFPAMVATTSSLDLSATATASSQAVFATALSALAPPRSRPATSARPGRSPRATSTPWRA